MSYNVAEWEQRDQVCRLGQSAGSRKARTQGSVQSTAGCLRVFAADSAGVYAALAAVAAAQDGEQHSRLLPAAE